MEFRILGPLEVAEGALQLAPRRAKQRALLVVLLLRANEVVASDLLIEALWGARPPRTAQTALHGHVSALRKLLGANRIVTRPPGYLLRVEPGELDLERFQTLLRKVRATADARDRSEGLRAALQLWRGEALADFRYEPFAQAEIARLEELRLAAIEDAIEAELALGAHLDVLSELERLVAEQPLRERPRAQLMLALYRAGRSSDALHAFQEGRRVLAEEVGIDPGPALQSLERQILAQDPTLEPPKPRERAEPRQERKLVTVLVAEVSSATQSDPEDLQRLLEPALERARELVSRFGGTVEPLFSNALVGIFGAPRAHEDDAERAVRAASALVDAFREDERLSVRVGIERGEALVTVASGHVDVTGDVLAAASRLQAAAAAGEVVAGDAAQRPLREGDGGREVPFVGREHELAVLERTYARVAGESAVQLVTIVGGPGSGKTRLAQEFRSRLESNEPPAWREGRCLPYGEGVTFWALGQIVKAQAGILESDGPEMSAQKLSAAVASLLPESDDRAWLEANVSPLVGVAGVASSSREQSFAAWRRFLEAIAWREPLVLLVEDLHWADPALLEFVDDLVGRAGGVPLLVVCTARLELLDARPQWGGGKRNATTIAVPPLSADETREVARSMLGGATPSETLIARAGGNPLFAQELARMDPARTVELPESLHAVIAARLDTLSPQVKDAAMDAAVVGEVFWSGAVAAIAGVEERELDERLQRLVASDVVRRARTSSVAGQSEYAFLHVLVRDVAYQQIPRGKRAWKHEAAAEWIERLAGDRVIDHAELIAHHYGVALQLVQAAGKSETADLEAKTRRFLELAGDRAMPLDVPAAERFYQSALELFDEDDKERVRVLLALARTAQEVGRLEESMRLYEDAIPKLRTYNDPLQLGRALVDYENAVSRLGKFEQRGKALAEAVELLEREPPGPELADAYNLVAREYMVAGRPAECLMWSEKAISLATELRLERNVIRALQFRGVARCSLNDLGGLNDLRESLRLGLEVGAGIETGLAYVNLGEWLFWTEGPEPCLELYEQGIEFSERRGLKHNAYWLRSDTLRRLFDLGRWDDLLGVVDEILAWERSRGETQITTVALIEKVGVLIRRGAVAEAKSLADAWLEPARAIDDPQVLAPALVCAALVELANGDDATAIRHLEEFEDSTRDRAPIWRALWVADAARICVAADALGLAKRLVTNLDVVAPRHVYGALSARAVLAEADERLDEAFVAYAEASTRWREFGNVLEEGHALLGQGRCLLRLDRADEVAAPLAEARHIFDRLEARPLVLEVDELLAQAPAT